MPQVPQNPNIYHITHAENLSGIMLDGALWSDAERIRRGSPCNVIGMNEIKRRRLEELAVHCYRGLKVGECVPFYFCPRSVMLYLLYRGNSPGLEYQGGQTPIVHLEADLHESIEWADSVRRRWAFSKGNAGARYMEFFNDTARLDMLDWNAIEARDWRDPDLKEGKQAEFLVATSFPWELIRRIGVINTDMADRAKTLIRTAQHQPDVVVTPGWYY